MTNKIKSILTIFGFILGHCSALGTASETIQAHPNHQTLHAATIDCDDSSDDKHMEHDYSTDGPQPPAPAVFPAPVQAPVNADTCCYYDCDRCGNIIAETGCVIEESVQDVSLGIGGAIICVGDTVGSIFN